MTSVLFLRFLGDILLSLAPWGTDGLRRGAPCVGDEERDSRNELLLYWVPSLSEAFRLFRRYCPPSTGREFMPYIVLGICRHLGLVAVMVPE